MAPVSAPRYEVVDFAQIEPVPCSCGEARRAFINTPDFPASIHVTDISLAARTHYHRQLTETYYILQCEPGSALELDGDIVPLRPGLCVLIRPGVRHRAVGKMRVLITAIPKFDPADEWFD